VPRHLMTVSLSAPPPLRAPWAISAFQDSQNNLMSKLRHPPVFD